MKKLLFAFLLFSCVGHNLNMPEDFVQNNIKTKYHEIATWQKIQSPKNNVIHIYVEGDGNSFDVYGFPTKNPTPKGTLVRDLAFNDKFDNVVYIARPCQFIMDENCSVEDWTNGRFSRTIIDSMDEVISTISKNKDVILIGYSGGAMVSGLVINQNKKIHVKQWITIAGVLNHKKWTKYFGDEDLDKSLNLDKLPNIKQKHFVGEMDEIVPLDLAKQWANEKDIIVVPSATHDKFDNLKIFD